MIKRTHTWLATAGVLALLVFLSACTSSGPATTYYVLDSQVSISESSKANSYPSIGIGPITLPAYLDNMSLVSKAKNNVLNVSGYHAWAEPLDSAVARVLSRGVAATLNHEDVWAFPWDLRNRPTKQINISIEQLDGVRGESLSLQAKWFVYDSVRNEVLSRGDFNQSQSLNSSSYSDYVGTMENLLSEFAIELAALISEDE